MSSCLSSGRTAYGFDLDIVVKPSSSPATSSRSTHSSPSSTLSESSNSPLAISTKRARAPRKRPNQTYNEAAALLSTAYPSVFSTKSLPKLCRKNARPFVSFSAESPAELIPPFSALGDAGFLLHQYVPDEPSPRVEPRPTSSSKRSSACLSPASVEFREPNSPAWLDDDFDAESILDEEVGEGIDSIMGNLSVDTNGGGANGGEDSPHYGNHANTYLDNVAVSHGFGWVFKFGYGHHGGNMRRALRRADDGEWWRSPTVEVLKIAPKLMPALALSLPAPPADKKKVQKVEKVLDKASKVEPKMEAASPAPKAETAAASTASTQQQPEPGKVKPVLSLKLDYEQVMKSWSGSGSPFSDDGDSPESRADTIVRICLQIPPPTTSYEQVMKSWSGRGSPFSDDGDSPESRADTIARLSQMELFPEGAGGLREASVMRYKEKRRARLFSKKIRYQVRKVNAMKASGRFVRRPSLSS